MDRRRENAERRKMWRGQKTKDDKEWKEAFRVSPFVKPNKQFNLNIERFRPTGS